MLFDRSLIEDALPPVASASVAHYTKIGTLCDFLSSSPPGWGSAWATPVQFLNDRQELSLGLEVLKKIATQPPQPGPMVTTAITDLLTTFGALNTDAFQMSFSGDPDELGQWRGYAANGMGCSVVTDALEVKRVGDIAGWVLYDSAEKEKFARAVIDKLSKENDPNLIGQALAAAASYMKHDGFRHEMEFRLLKFPDLSEVGFRESGDRLVPYTDYLKGASRLPAPKPLPINKILVGPGWQLYGKASGELACHHVAQGIQRLLEARGLQQVSIESSRIPYDPK